MLLNRRTLLLQGVTTGAALTLAPGLLAQNAFAAAPLAGAQVAGVYRRKIGSLEVTAILDGFAPLNASYFTGTDQAELLKILENVGLSADLPTSVNAFVINSGDKTYLVDTGIGANQAFGPNLGRTIANLAAAGITPEQIDGIILTHIHPDHAEGLISAEGTALFPNAELVIHELESAFWLDDGSLSRAPDQMKPLFASARKSIKPYESRTRLAKDGDIFPGIALHVSPGHTPGHSVIHIASGSDQMLLMADTLHNAAIHTAKPDTGFALDTDAAVAAASRHRIFDMVAADKMLVAATHVAFPSFGRVFIDGDHYRYVPADYAYTL